MATTYEIPSGGQDLASTTSNEASSGPSSEQVNPRRHTLVTARRRSSKRTSFTAPALVVSVCGLALLTTLRHGWAGTDDGAGVVPLIAIAGIALAAVRWHPDLAEPPARSVSNRFGISVCVAAAALMVAIWLVGLPESWLGPIITLAIIGSYLSTWGYRALALLRSMTLMSLLTWRPIAEALHDIVRSTLDQPSELIYQRLGRIALFGVDDEPWRLLTASLHRGSVVTIATVALAIAASRMRLSPRTVIDLVVTVAAAIIVHHVVVLASPIDDYDPADVTQVATNPTLEIGISIVAVAILAVIRARRERAERVSTRASVPHGALATASTTAATPGPKPVSPAADRDPVIFEPARRRPHPAVTAMLLAGVAPLAASACGW